MRLCTLPWAWSKQLREGSSMFFLVASRVWKSMFTYRGADAQQAGSPAPCHCRSHTSPCCQGGPLPLREVPPPPGPNRQVEPAHLPRSLHIHKLLEDAVRPGRQLGRRPRPLEVLAGQPELQVLLTELGLKEGSEGRQSPWDGRRSAVSGIAGQWLVLRSPSANPAPAATRVPLHSRGLCNS